MKITDTLKTKILEWTKANGANPDNVFPFMEDVGFKACPDCEGGLSGIKIVGALSSIKNMDREGDIVIDTAFDKTIKELKKLGKLPMLKDHDASTDSQIGSFRKFVVKDKLLQVEGFISETPNTMHIIKLIEDGHLNTLSMGGLFTFANGGARDKQGRRFIEEVALFEGSVVVVPANPKATFTQKSPQPETQAKAKAEPVAEAKAQPVASHRDKVMTAVSILKSAWEG